MPPLPQAETAPPRPIPTEAMQRCNSLCTLPARFDNLPLEEQAQLLIACRIRDYTEHEVCSARQRALAEWIERGER